MPKGADWTCWRRRRQLIQSASSGKTSRQFQQFASCSTRGGLYSGFTGNRLTSDVVEYHRLRTMSQPDQLRTLSILLLKSQLCFWLAKAKINIYFLSRQSQLWRWFEANNRPPVIMCRKNPLWRSASGKGLERRKVKIREDWVWKLANI